MCVCVGGGVLGTAGQTDSHETQRVATTALLQWHDTGPQTESENVFTAGGNRFNSITSRRRQRALQMFTVSPPIDWREMSRFCKGEKVRRETEWQMWILKVRRAIHGVPVVADV